MNPYCPVIHRMAIVARSVTAAQTGSCRVPAASYRPPEMLPLPLQFIIAIVAYAIDERMARRIEYLLEEVRVLREVCTESTGRKRISFTDEQRRRLAIKGKALTPEEREVPETTSSNDNAMPSSIRCRSRLGGLLNLYHRRAA